MVKLIDNHAHLQHERFNDSLSYVMDEIDKRMEYVVVSGANHEWNVLAIEKFSHHPKILLTLGIHPVDAVKMNEKEFEHALEFIREHAKKNNKVVGIGEIGMDFHWIKDKQQIEIMEERFIQQISLADELGLPIVVHSWDAEYEAIEIVHKHKNDNRVAFHCYSSHKHQELIHEYGFYASVCTNIFRSKNVKKHAKRLNVENMLTETDAPYLAPTPGEINYPWNVELILEKVASLKGIAKEELADIVYDNFVSLYGL